MIIESQLYHGMEQDLNIFLLNDKNINAFMDIFSRKQLHDQSLWIVDITDFPEPLDQVLQNLNALEAQFDDQIILFRGINESFVEFWEVYKISQNTPLQIGNVGEWSEGSGVNLKSDKHRLLRLRDLQGLHLKVATAVHKPYTIEMIPDDEFGYEINGLFAEVFHALQVQKPIQNQN